MHQTSLFTEQKTTAERFAEFVAANEWFVQECLRQCRESKADGNKRGSVKSLFEQHRHKFRAGAGCKYGLNNSYTSLFARLLIERDPSLNGFFELR